MGPSARVGSIEKLQALHEALARFGVEAQAALDSGRSEVRHALDHLHDALRRWQVEVQRRQEDVNRARADLSHARAIRQDDSSRAGTVEQEMALQKAKVRLQEAEEKVERTRRWLRLLPDAIAELETPSRHLAGMLEADLRQALALLDGKIAALTAYAEMTRAEPGKASP